MNICRLTTSQSFLVTAAAVVLFASTALSQWTIVGITSRPMELPASNASGDFWLEVTLRNSSSRTMYLPGLSPRWYLVESFIKEPTASVWERQNVGVDQPLQMLPVKADENITIRKREALRHVGWPMMFTFRVAYSEGDQTGAPILLDAFTVPPISPSK